MPNIELVRKINSEMRRHLDEAQRHGDNPRVIALLDAMVQLTQPTNADGVPEPPCKHEIVVEGMCAQCGGVLPSLQPVTATQASCPPHLNINPYGVCRDCGQCLHEFRSSSGICNQCGDPAPEASAL